LIAEARPANDARIIDVGGGDSTLVDDLLGQGYSNLTVLDISAAALDRAKLRLGGLASRVQWVEADIAEANLPADEFDLWHDRALFHFLTRSEVRSGYLALLGRSLRSGGHAVIATFAENGPEECSGLPTKRYSEEALGAELGPTFELIDSRMEAHQKPRGGEQQFVYCLFRKA
jgi:SAM-dependent methyltransferase